MIDNIGFSLQGLQDYIHWQTEDKRTLKKKNKRIEIYQCKGLYGDK